MRNINRSNFNQRKVHRAIAEFKTKTNREKFFKLMQKYPAMIKLMFEKFIDEIKIITAGFKGLVSL